MGAPGALAGADLIVIDTAGEERIIGGTPWVYRSNRSGRATLFTRDGEDPAMGNAPKAHAEDTPAVGSSKEARI